MGNFQDAIDRAAELAGIEGEPVVLYPEEKRKKIWEYLVQAIAEGMEVFFRSMLEQRDSVTFHPDGFSVAGRR